MSARGMAGLALKRAAIAWAPACPEWVAALAAECDRTSQARAGTRIGFAATTVNQVLGNCYPAGTEKVQDAVEAQLMGVTVMCPVMGEIPRRDCARNQRRAFAATNALRVEIWRHCHGQGGRPLCPNSMQGG